MCKSGGLPLSFLYSFVVFFSRRCFLSKIGQIWLFGRCHEKFSCDMVFLYFEICMLSYEVNDCIFILQLEGKKKFLIRQSSILLTKIV